MVNTQEIAVCFDCLHELANGETTPDADPTRVTRTGLEDCEVTRGGEYADYCPNYPDWKGEWCECESLGFRRESCQLCTSDLAGDRFLATLWWD